MGRPGRTGGGSRSSGVHRPGSSSGGGARPGRGSAGPSRGPSRGPVGGGGHHHHHSGHRMPPPPPRHHHHHHHHHGGPVMPPPRHRRTYSRGRSNPLSTFLAFLLLLIIMLVAMACNAITDMVDRNDRNSHPANNSSNYSSNYSSNVKREKLKVEGWYIEDCIKDELGWFENATAAEAKLKGFWEKTGVQPYIVLKAYDSKVKTDKQREEWTNNYYDENFEAENVFLYVYFAGKDADNDEGLDAYTAGSQATAVMDEEAVDIFWNNVDRYWNSDLSTDDMFVKIFSDTANEIMR